MKKHNFKNNIILTCTVLFLLSLTQSVFAADYMQSPAENIDYYSVGMRSLQSRDYTGAIDAFKRALYKNPKDLNERYARAVALITTIIPT